MYRKPHGASLIIAPLLCATSTFLWTEGRYGAAGGTLLALSGVFWAHGFTGLFEDIRRHVPWYGTAGLPVALLGCFGAIAFGLQGFFEEVFAVSGPQSLAALAHHPVTATLVLWTPGPLFPLTVFGLAAAGADLGRRAALPRRDGLPDEPHPPHRMDRLSGRRAAPGALRLAGMDAAPAVRPRRRRAPGSGRGRRTMTATSGSFAEPSPTGPACTRRRPGYGEPERDPRGRGLPDRVAETAPPSPTIKEGAGGVGRLPRRFPDQSRVPLLFSQLRERRDGVTAASSPPDRCRPGTIRPGNRAIRRGRAFPPQ